MQQHEINFDFRNFYLNELTVHPIAAILGLSEKGQIQDAVEIEKFLTSDMVCIVKAAMTALMRLNKVAYNVKITGFLDNESCGIVKLARKLIDFPDYKRINDIFISSNYEHSKLNCLQILSTASKWESLIYLLKAMLDLNPNIKFCSLKLIDSWLYNFNRSFVAIKIKERNEIQHLLDKLDNILPSKIITDIKFFIK